MSAIEVGRAVRTALEARFGALFNEELAAACDEFLVGDLKFAIEFGDEEPSTDADEAMPPTQNYYRGDRTLEDLLQHDEPDLPALAMWVGEGKNRDFDAVQSGRMFFSGVVAVYWRWFLFVPMRKEGMVELAEAVQHAMLATLEPELISLNYRGDLSWGNPIEAKWTSQDAERFGWVQEILYTATFEVNV